MVATAIMGLIGLLVFMVYSGSTTMWFSTSERIDLHHSVRTAVNRMAFEVRMARFVYVPWVSGMPDPDPLPDCYGDPDVILCFIDSDKNKVAYTLDSASREILRNGQPVARSIYDLQAEREGLYAVYLLVEAKERDQQFYVDQDVNLRNLQIHGFDWEEWIND